MVVKVHFDHVNRSNEQDLAARLVAEAVRTMGMDVWYVMRTPVGVDAVINESEYSFFHSAVLTDAYLEDSEGAMGDGFFMSKFGREVRDEYTFKFSTINFRDDVSSQYPDVQRPREGDALFVPMMGQLFVVKHVERRAFHYQMGALQAWDVVTELYENNSDVFDTGVPAIDGVYGRLTMDVNAAAILQQDGSHLLTEDRWVLVDEDHGDGQTHGNEAIEDEGHEFIDYESVNPFLNGVRY